MRTDAQRRQAAEKRRPNATDRGYNYRWKQARKRFLQQHPLCCKCLEEGHVVAATVVDHIVPHKGDQKLFWNRNNWQPLCKPCHDRKTVKEDGGFGI
ncbi:MAG: HNH endonuclease [Pseudomonadales bacterium]|nr:HNH endonuclease [Pseudomonadales bacterium]